MEKSGFLLVVTILLIVNINLGGSEDTASPDAGDIGLLASEQPFYIDFGSSSFCYEERVYTYHLSGKIPLNNVGKAACAIAAASGYEEYYTTIDAKVYEDDTVVNDYLGSEPSISVYAHTDTCDYIHFYSDDNSRGFTDDSITKQIDEWLEGNNIEIFVEATGNSIVSSYSHVNTIYVYSSGDCKCFSGSCCDMSLRPYNFKSSGSQPTDYIDSYFCEGDNSPIGTSYSKKRDYYCNGADSNMHHTDTTADTCGTCEYCTAGDSTCNYYGSSTTCGTKDCDYLDTSCRDYHDLDKTCSSGNCISPTCNSYTDEPKHTYCGSGKECDGSGSCITCTSHSYSLCYDSDVFWYDSCDNRQEKSVDCGEDSVSELWTFCQGNDLYVKRKYYDRWCESAVCQESSEIVDEFEETCENGCENGECKPAVCDEDSDCGTPDWTGNPWCSGSWIYQKYRYYDCNNPGTSSASCGYHDVDTRKEYCDYGCEFDSCKPEPDIKCYSDSDCGTNGWYGSSWCGTDGYPYYIGSVYQKYKSYRCNNPGTYESYCSENYVDAVIDNCHREDCTDWQDPTCYDYCGNWGGNYCKNNDVYRSRTCHHEGCTSGACFDNTNVEEQLVQDCSSGCENGECKARLNGDTNGDCKVDIFDLAKVGSCYGKSLVGCESADLNADSSINIFDLATVGRYYGSIC